MFDRYEHHTHESHQSVTVTEKRAPTDESVRLLKEMEQAAQEKVLQSIRLENCPIDCVVHSQLDVMSHQQVFLALAKVNGKRIEAERRFEVGAKIEEIAVGLRDELAKQIANKLLTTSFEQMERHQWPRIK